MIVPMGSVCVLRPGDRVLNYLATVARSVDMDPQVQRDSFNRTGPSRCGICIISVQPKCGNNGRLKY